jgi:hypothetical protein
MLLTILALAFAGTKLASGDVGAPQAGTPATGLAAGGEQVGIRQTRSVFVKIAPGSSATIGTFAELRVVATCGRDGGFEGFEVEPLAGRVALRVSGSGDGGQIDAAANGARLSLNEAGSTRNARGISTFSASPPGEPAVFGTLGYSDTFRFENRTVCAVYGKVAS